LRPYSYALWCDTEELLAEFREFAGSRAGYPPQAEGNIIASRCYNLPQEAVDPDILSRGWGIQRFQIRRNSS